VHKIIELVLKLYVHVYEASTFTRSYVVYANYVVSCHCLYVHLYLHAEVALVEHLININVSISTEGKSISQLEPLLSSAMQPDDMFVVSKLSGIIHRRTHDEKAYDSRHITLADLKAWLSARINLDHYTKAETSSAS